MTFYAGFCITIGITWFVMGIIWKNIPPATSMNAQELIYTGILMMIAGGVFRIGDTLKGRKEP